MRFGKIDTLILFGGGQRLVNFISCAKEYKNFKIIVLSAQRLLQSKLTNGTKNLKDHLAKNKIKYFEIEDIAKFNIGRFINENALGISFGAPWLFSNTFVEKFNGRLINGHGMNLPRNRGGGGFSWQIMRGEKIGCHLFHLINKGIDTGNIIFFDRFVFPKSCRIPKEYQEFYEKTEVPFFRKFLKKLLSDTDFKEIVQDGRISSYFPRLSTVHHGFINWNWKAIDIEKFICAFDLPYPAASTFIDGKRVFLRGAKKYVADGRFHPFMNGLIYRKTKGTLFISVSDGAIAIREVYGESRNNIFGKIRVGHRFITPTKFLDEALLFHAAYDTKGLKIKGKTKG